MNGNHKLPENEIKKLKNTVIVRYIMAVIVLGIILFVSAGSLSLVMMPLVNF